MLFVSAAKGLVLRECTYRNPSHLNGRVIPTGPEATKTGLKSLCARSPFQLPWPGGVFVGNHGARLAD